MFLFQKSRIKLEVSPQQNKILELGNYLHFFVHTQILKKLKCSLNEITDEIFFVNFYVQNNEQNLYKQKTIFEHILSLNQTFIKLNYKHFYPFVESNNKAK